MASRRIISTEKTILDQDDPTGSSPAASQKSDIKPAVPTYSPPSRRPNLCCTSLYLTPPKLTFPSRHVIVKLLAFTAAMIVVPIGSYFATVSTIFKGSHSPLLSLPSAAATSD